MLNLFFGGFRERGGPFLLADVSGRMNVLHSVKIDILETDRLFEICHILPRTKYFASYTNFLQAVICSRGDGREARSLCSMCVSRMSDGWIGFIFVPDDGNVMEGEASF